MTTRQIAESYLHDLLNVTDELSRLAQLAAVVLAHGSHAKAIEELEKARLPAVLIEPRLRRVIRAIREVTE